jgi:hypothetical protein
MRASHIKTFPGHGSFISSNLVGETHVPRNAPGTPQANARFRRPGRTRGARMRRMRVRRAEEPAPRGRARAEAGGLGRSRVGSGEQRPSEGESSVGLGRSKGLGEKGERRARGEREVPDKQNVPLAPGRSGRPSGTLPAPGRRAPRPPRDPTMRSGRPRRRRRNAGADPLGHRSFMESA